MSGNEERIAQWRARREAASFARDVLGDLPGWLGPIATRAQALATRPMEDRDALLAAVVVGIAEVPQASPADRRAIYDALGRGLDYGMREAALDHPEAEARRVLLRIVVRLVDADVRDGVEVLRPGYRPAEFDSVTKPILLRHEGRLRQSAAQDASAARRRATLDGTAYAVEMSDEDDADLAQIRALLDHIDVTKGQRLAGHDTTGLRDIAALLRFQVRVLMAESRFALLWTLLGPAALLTIISALYLLTGTRQILNMDVQTFSLVGATTWIMFRNVIFRTSSAFYGQRALLNLRPLGPLAIGFSNGLIYFLTFQGVFFILITGGALFDFFSLPDNLPGFVFWVAMMGISGSAVGVIFGSIAVIWPYFLRFAPILERALQVFSSVFIVSEQLPPDYRPYFLISPFAHALQLMRSAYFPGYQSQDASAEYFFIGLAMLIVVAALLERLVRSRNHPM